MNTFPRGHRRRPSPRVHGSMCHHRWPRRLLFAQKPPCAHRLAPLRHGLVLSLWGARRRHLHGLLGGAPLRSGGLLPSPRPARRRPSPRCWPPPLSMVCWAAILIVACLAAAAQRTGASPMRRSDTTLMGRLRIDFPFIYLASLARAERLGGESGLRLPPSESSGRMFLAIYHHR
jgi:hypothetical protein